MSHGVRLRSCQWAVNVTLPYQAPKPLRWFCNPRRVSITSRGGVVGRGLIGGERVDVDVNGRAGREVMEPGFAELLGRLVGAGEREIGGHTHVRNDMDRAA